MRGALNPAPVDVASREHCSSADLYIAGACVSAGCALGCCAFAWIDVEPFFELISILLTRTNLKFIADLYSEAVNRIEMQDP